MHFDGERVRRIEAYVEGAVEQGRIAGAVAAVGERGRIAWRGAYGLRAVEPEPEPMTLETMFDLASVTKVMATWPVMMRMVERGQASLAERLGELFPYPVHEGIAGATLEQVMTHMAGLPERTWIRQYGEGLERAARGILATRAVYAPGSEVRYCSRGPILLGHLAELRTGMSMAQAAAEIWAELGMGETCASPVPEALRSRVAPTERQGDGNFSRGVTHDENAAWLGGLQGHAGAFSTVEDLARFCAMVTGRGVLEGRRVLREASVTRSLALRTPQGISRRGLLWNASGVPGHDEGLLFFHYGFTGIGLWVEPLTQTFAILLTNVVHPKRRASPVGMRALRDGFKSLCWEPGTRGGAV